MRLSIIWLIAGREIRLRSRTKAFLISTVVVCLGVAAAVAAPALFANDDPETTTIGVVGEASPELRAGFEAAGVVVQREVITEVVAADDVERALDSGDVDVVFEGNTATWFDTPDPVEGAIVQSGATAAARAARAGELGVDPQTLGQLLTPVVLAIETIDDPIDDSRIGVALLGTILLFLGIQLHGAAVLQGVIEEKASRIVEVLLTHVKASELLAGKVLGIGAVGVSQITLVGITAAVMSALVEGTSVPDVGVVEVVSFIGWFVLGFLLYATAFAVAGSLVSRQEDAQAATAPLAVPFIAAYAGSLGMVENPDALFGRVMSMFPLTAALSMPVRLAAGSPAMIEVLVAVFGSIAAIVALIWFGGRIYRKNLLRTGARVPWREVFRRTPSASS